MKILMRVAHADHSGSRHGTNYENLIGRHFVDSDDEDSDYTVASNIVN